MVQWSSVISHAVYGGIGAFTAGFQYNNPGPAHVSFSILILRSVAGIIHELLDKENNNAKKVYDFLDSITWFFAFPLYVCHLWLKADYRPEIAYIHPAFGLIPFCLYLCDKDNEDATSILMVGNAISACYITITSKDWYGLAATFVFAMTHGVIKIESNNDMDKDDTFNFMLALYMLLVWNSWTCPCIPAGMFVPSFRIILYTNV